MRTLADSTTAADIPLTFDMVAGYIDGAFRWSDADWARFPDKVKVRIATQAATNDGDVLDVEQGDATPDEAVGWVQMRRAAGADPSIYTSAAEWSVVNFQFAQAGVVPPHYWLAQWDNRPTLDGYAPIASAKQYANEPLTGGHYDASVVADYWPGVDDMDEAAVKAILAAYGLTDENKVPSIIKQLAELAQHEHGKPTPPVQP